MKRILIFLLFFAAIARGQTYTFKQGESVSILFVFDSTYNPNRIDDIAVAIGSKSVGSLADGKIQTTANTRQFKLQLTSAETKNSFGGALIISVEDSILGVKKVDAGQIKFVSSSQFNNSAVNTGTDLTVSLEIEEAGITSNATLATIFKGDTGATGATGANAVNPNFTAATGAAGSNVSITGTYPNLTLTVPRGDTGAPGSDASVTSSNINAALGYTPVSPTQLGTKSDTSHTHPILKVTGLQTALDSKAASSHTHAQSDVTGLVAALGAKRDTSASITTAKISDWTAAWAARFAAQSTSDLAEGTNLYHTTARVQAVGDARYLPLTGGVLTNASTYQLRLAYDASNYLSATVSSTGSTTFSGTGTNVGYGFINTGSGTFNITGGNGLVVNSIATIGPATMHIRTYGANPLIFFTNNTEAARIHADGNVSVGSATNAGFKLDVTGTVRATQYNIGATSTNFIAGGGTGEININNALCDLRVGGLSPAIWAFVDNTKDIGTAAKRWRTGYFGTSVISASYQLSALNTAPASATDTGTAGEIRVTANYIYVCTATNTWVRAALSTWP